MNLTSQQPPAVTALRTGETGEVSTEVVEKDSDDSILPNLRNDSFDHGSDRASVSSSDKSSERRDQN